MSKPGRRQITELHVRFQREGTELSVTFEHDDELPHPGTKAREGMALLAARVALEGALASVSGPEAHKEVLSIGESTDTRTTTEHLFVEGG